MKTIPGTAGTRWCTVFTAWPVSISEGRKPRIDHTETARAFTWSDQGAYGLVARSERTTDLRLDTGSTQ
ncbi:MAG: hypothetical protein EP330_14465 [Deltaproteobacteria bacterium]|nr:MAG: hypothetical protein EP330_14465 [Deltaproteobacteria bacterium]